MTVLNSHCRDFFNGNSSQHEPEFCVGNAANFFGWKNRKIIFLQKSLEFVYHHPRWNFKRHFRDQKGRLPSIQCWNPLRSRKNFSTFSQEITLLEHHQNCVYPSIVFSINSFITSSGHDVYKRIRTDSISSMSSMLSFASSIPESIESTDSRYRHLKRRKNAETRPSEKHKVLDFSKSFQPQTLVCAKCELRSDPENLKLGSLQKCEGVCKQHFHPGNYI